MLKGIARTGLIVAVLLAAVACGYDTGATFNADGSVTISLKFLFPKSLMTGATTGGSVQGLSQADIDKASAQLAAKYPGAKIAAVTEGDESGAQITVPFKSEKDAFAFMTQPTSLNPSQAASGSSPGIDLSNTGGLFVSATHTSSGQTDIYTFKTQPPPMASPSPGSQQVITPDQLGSIFTFTFSLTVPNEITSAPGALFTLDRKTAIWKVSLTQPQTLSATTGPNATLAGATIPVSSGQSPVLLIGAVAVAIVIGVLVGMVIPWRRVPSPAGVAMAPVAAWSPPPSAPPAANVVPAAPWLPPPGAPPAADVAPPVPWLPEPSAPPAPPRHEPPATPPPPAWAPQPLAGSPPGGVQGPPRGAPPPPIPPGT